MDEATLTSLRSAGAMIGETNMPSWAELIDKFKLDGVRWAIPNAKREFDAKQVTATQVAKALRHSLKCHEPERKKGEPLVAPKPSPVIAAASPKPRGSPMVEASPKKGRRANYIEAIQRHDGVGAAEIARELGISAQAAGMALKRMVSEGLVLCDTSGGRYPVYRLHPSAIFPGVVQRGAPMVKASAEVSRADLAALATAKPGRVEIVPIAPRGVLGEISAEIDRALARFKPFNSAHEGYAVLLEEVDELWDEVKKNQSRRDYGAMRRECIQVAAMAARLIVDVCDAANRGHEKRSA